jgi:FHA domain
MEGMSRSGRWASGGVRLLPAGTGSLARGLPPAPAGTLFVLGERGGIAVAPTARFSVIFGRNEPEVHVCVGAGDPGVSRQHGVLHHDGQRWVVRNTGQLPIRFPGSHLLLSGHAEPLAVAYTPLFIRSGHGREHLLEVRVAGPALTKPSGVGDDASTRRMALWELSERERLVAVALGQRYLRHEAFPQPLSWNQVAEQLGRLRPEERWSAKRAEHVMAAVRERLARAGVPGLTRAEVGEPIGNTLNHNLMMELLLSTTLVPPDLKLLDFSPGRPHS